MRFIFKPLVILAWLALVLVAIVVGGIVGVLAANLVG